MRESIERQPKCHKIAKIHTNFLNNYFRILIAPKFKNKLWGKTYYNEKNKFFKRRGKKMNLFITTGTYDFLRSIKNKHANETIILIENAHEAALLHETENKTIFQSPRKYEIIDASGDLAEHGYLVFNNIPVTDEGRPIFEYRFKNRDRLIEKTPGFQAIRVLRPLHSNTYIILTQWQDQHSFNNWKNSKEYNKAHEKPGSSDGVDKQPQIFSSPSYVTTYTVPKEEKK
jgi:heme-degrading monooxygenase HmoA